MNPVDSTLTISLAWWQRNQDEITRVIAPLTDEQLTLRLRPHLRTIGELAAHMVMARAWYLQGVMGEGGAEIAPLTHWDDPQYAPRTAAELVQGFAQTWQLLSECIRRWTADDLNQTFYINWLNRDMPRSWIIWHIIEHEIHHGGELAFTLGGNGLQAQEI